MKIFKPLVAAFFGVMLTVAGSANAKNVTMNIGY